MKNFILLFVLGLSLTLNAFSQIEKSITKGNKIIGGSASISYSNIISTTSITFGSSTVNEFNFSLDPTFGCFVIDNLAIGLNANIDFYKTVDDNSLSFGIGPFGKYYFTNGLIAQLQAKYTINNDSHNPKQFNFSPGIGYAIFLNSKVSLEPGVFYKFQNYKSDNYKVKSNMLYFGLSLNMYL